MLRKSVYLVPVILLLFTSAVWAAGEPVSIPKIAKAPTIDGNLADWAGMPGYYVSSLWLTAGAGVDNDDDLSLWFMVGYDDDNLYVAYRIIDNVLVMERTGANTWQTDCAELWLGSQQFGITLENGKNVYVHSWMGVDASKVKAALVPAAGGYTVEAAFPKSVVESSIGKKMVSGSSFQISFGADDADSSGGDRDGQIFFPAGWEWNSLSTYATATFE
jgi:hypothetical protein